MKFGIMFANTGHGSSIELIAGAGVPPGPKLERGMDDPRVVPLRRRLAATGDIASDPTSSSAFDVGLEQGLKRFQRSVGIASLEFCLCIDLCGGHRSSWEHSGQR